MQLVLFKDTLEVDSKPQYGVLQDNEDNPYVVCLECGSIIEYGDYEILKRLSWSDVVITEKSKTSNKYVVCMDSVWVRDSQMMETGDMSDEEFENIDFMSCENDDRWHDMEPMPFIAIIEATSNDEARQKAAEQKRYDKRCLFTIKI